jgi:hypothetical protein
MKARYFGAKESMAKRRNGKSGCLAWLIIATPMRNRSGSASSRSFSLAMRIFLGLWSRVCVLMGTM